MKSSNRPLIYLAVLALIVVILWFGTNVQPRHHDYAPGCDETISRLKIVWSAIETFREENREWPQGNDSRAMLAELADVPRAREILLTLPGSATVKSAHGWAVKDAWDGDFVYKSTGGPGGAPVLFSMGPDGKTGTPQTAKDNLVAHEH